MADRYFFDKRVIKKSLLKYLGLFSIAFVILVPINALFLVNKVSQGMGLFISILIGMAIVLLGEYIIYLVKKKRNINNKETNKK